MLTSVILGITGIAVTWIVWELRPSRHSRFFFLIVSAVWLAFFVWDGYNKDSATAQLYRTLGAVMGLRPNAPTNLSVTPVTVTHRAYVFGGVTDADLSKLAPQYRQYFQ
jgi:hypothetical protein